MQITISRRTRKLIILFTLISLSFFGVKVGINIGLINLDSIFHFSKEETTIMNQTNINQTIINWQECEGCPPEFKPRFLYVTFNETIDQDVEIIIPNDQHVVIHSSSNKQPQTIGYCECNGSEIIGCNLFYQYRTEPNIKSNYTISDFSNMSICEENPIPGT